MSDTQRTIKSMQEWEQCPDGTYLRAGNAVLARKGADEQFQWDCSLEYIFEYCDGWIKHEGDECPVDGDTLVMVMYCDMRRGYTPIVSDENVSWHRVTHYRIIERISEKSNPEKVKVAWYMHDDGLLVPTANGSSESQRLQKDNHWTRVKVDMSGDIDE